AISGTTALVGAFGNDDAGSNSGSAYLYDFSDPCNITEIKLTASDAAASDCFGLLVAISGSTALVGAQQDDDAGTDSGSAYLYDFSDPCSIIETKLTASDANAFDIFGYSVAISGSTAIVGAPQDDDACPDNPDCDSGSAYIFAREPILVDIDIDIKPGSCPNPLNVKSKGVLPVAILGTEDVNVITIDPNSIGFSIGDVNVRAIRYSYEDVAAPVSDENECNCTEDGPDGYTDLTLKFETQAIVEALGQVTDGEEWILLLTGVLHDDTPIEAEDCIVIRSKSKPGK
ncbi:MAG: FG-GAP repeat protein, partial [Planctomycetota bacterium]